MQRNYGVGSGSQRIFLAVGGTSPGTPLATWESGTTSNPGGGTWISSNTPVATVNGFGVVAGEKHGTAQIVYLYTDNPGIAELCDDPSCPGPETFSGSGPASVSLSVTGVSQGSFYQGEVGGLAITRTGFSALGTPTVAITDGDSSISISSATVNSDSSISAFYNVPCTSDVNSDYTLTVTFLNSDGIGASLPGSLGVTLPNAPKPSIKLNGTTISGTQSVVVGQQISLTGSQSLPMCTSLDSQTWTSPTSGTPIGNFVASSSSGVVTPISQVPTDAAGYKFYFTTRSVRPACLTPIR